MAAASRARETSRSMTRQPNAASTQNIKKMSKIPVRDNTNSSPSSASKNPAMQPSSVDRVIRRTIRHNSKIASEPNNAVENRQPNEFSPKIPSPTAISHLPTGGITTYSPQPVPVQAWKMFVNPCGISVSIATPWTFLTAFHSTPCCR
jgi:hypothetical protein